MRKTIVQVMSGGAVLAALATPALAQVSATATASATTTIIQPLSISKSTDLVFGTIVKPSTAAATIAISATGGGRTITGGNALATGSSTSSRALFNVNGEGGSVFSISVPASFAMISGSNSLVVSTTASAGSATLSGSLGSQGSASFGVGGSFQLATNTPSGAYSGNFIVTVSYN